MRRPLLSMLLELRFSADSIPSALTIFINNLRLVAIHPS